MRGLFRWTALLVGLVLLKHVYLARYAHPAADDFCYAAKAHGTMLWQWSVGEYNHWNGRYFSNLLVGRGPLWWSHDFLFAYRVVPILLMLLTLVSFWILIRVITRRSFSTKDELCAAILMFGLYLYAMPDIGEGYYWYTGAITYQLANSLVLLYSASLLMFLRARFLFSRSLHLFVIALLASIIIGMDEIHTLLMIGLNALILFILRKRDERVNGWMIAFLGWSLACAGIVVFAPGNAVRATNFPAAHALFRSLEMTALQTARFSAIWILSPALLALSVLYIHVHDHLKTRVPLVAASFFLRPFQSALLLVIITAACVFPLYWSTNVLGTYRTLNTAYFFFLPLWFINLSVWINHGWLNVLLRRPMTRGIAILYSTLAVVSIGFVRNGYRACGDLIEGRAASFDAEMMDRYAQFISMPDGMVTIRDLTDPPRTLCVFRQSGNDRRWMNGCEARYFGVDDGRVITLPMGSP